MKPWFRVGHCLPSWDIEDVTPLTPDYKQQPAKVYLGPCRCCLWKSTGLMTPLLVICSDAPGGKAVPSELWKLWITAPLTNALFTYQRGPVPEGRGGGGPQARAWRSFFIISLYTLCMSICTEPPDMFHMLGCVTSHCKYMLKHPKSHWGTKKCKKTRRTTKTNEMTTEQHTEAQLSYYKTSRQTTTKDIKPEM